MSKIRNVVNPTAFKTFFENTYYDVIKSPLAKTRVAIDQQLKKGAESIGKVEVPTRIRVGSLVSSNGMELSVVDLGITTMKDVVQKVSMKNSGENKNRLKIINE